MAIEYIMSEEELDKLVAELDKDTKKISKFQMKIRTSNHQYQEIQEFLEPYFEKATEGRKYISADVEDEAFIYDESEEE